MTSCLNLESNFLEFCGGGFPLKTLILSSLRSQVHGRLFQVPILFSSALPSLAHVQPLAVEILEIRQMAEVGDI